MRRVLFLISVIEYAVLGLLACVIGSAAAFAVKWAMRQRADRPLPWHLHPWINLTGALLTAVVVTIVGVLATWSVSARKPLGILRDT